MLDAALRQSPLAHLALERDARDARHPDHGIALSERPFRAILDVRAVEPTAIAALEVALALTLPRTANRVETGEDLKALWLGPDQWWAVGEKIEGPELAARVEAAAEGHFISATDVSEYYTTLRVEGPRARELLAKGCPLDLHPRVFAAGDCAQTLLAKSGVLLELLTSEEQDPEAGPCFELFVRRSFAEYLWLWLSDAAGEYGLSTVKG